MGGETPAPPQPPVEQKHIPAPETTKRTQTPEQKARRLQKKIEKQEDGRINDQQRAIDELRARGITDLSKFNGRTPEDVIQELNKNGAGWQNDETTKAYVQGGMELNRELQIARDQIRLEKNENNEQIDEQAIVTEARKRVLEKRVAAAMSKTPGAVSPPEGDDKAEGGATVQVGVETKPKTPEEIAAEKKAADEKKEQDRKAAAEKTEQARIEKAINDYVAAGGSSDLARETLVGIAAAEEGVVAAKNKADKLEDALANAVTDKQKEAIKPSYERAKKAQEEAERALAEERKKFERLKTDPKASVEDRLFAYDMDLIQVNIELESADQTVDKLESAVDTLATDATISPERRAAVQARLDKAKADRQALLDKKTKLNDEREQIGEPGQRDINYVTAEVMLLLEKVPLRTTKTIDKDEKEVVTTESAEERRAAILKDSLGYLQDQVNTPEGMVEVLEQSGIDPRTQKKLLDTAIAKAAERRVKEREVEGVALNTGKTGLMAILLLLYTAYGANKKSKGQAMG